MLAVLAEWAVLYIYVTSTLLPAYHPRFRDDASAKRPLSHYPRDICSGDAPPQPATAFGLHLRLTNVTSLTSATAIQNATPKRIDTTRKASADGFLASSKSATRQR